MAFKDVLDRHHHCQVVIIPRYHKGKPHLVPGLYCSDHAKLIKWLSPDSAEELVSAGVESLEPIASDKMAHIREQVQRKYPNNTRMINPKDIGLL